MPHATTTLSRPQTPHVLVTGATGGIGSAISRGLAAAGAETALCARNQQKCRELADEISAHGGAATAHALDISDLDSIHIGNIERHNAFTFRNICIDKGNILTFIFLDRKSVV